MKNILVTGGAGFIGSHLVEKLVARGLHVTVFDNLSTGSLENISNVRDAITFINDDIRDADAIKNACINIDTVFHLAAHVSVADSMMHPTACFETNVIGLLYVLQAAQLNQCQRFIFSSSASVYGNKELCVETDEPKPLSPYGHSKLIGEQLCTTFYKNFGLPIVLLRYFNVYGQRQKSGVVATMRAALEKNEPITLFGDGSQTRDFVSVEMVADANIAVALAPQEKVAGQVFNVATGKSITLNELLQKLKNEYKNYTAPVVYKPFLEGDIQFSSAVCKKLISLVD